jgi:hypothetical protein
VIVHLGAALLPALDRPHETNDLFIGNIALALQAHFLQTYLGRLQATRACRSGLPGNAGFRGATSRAPSPSAWAGRRINGCWTSG